MRAARPDVEPRLAAARHAFLERAAAAVAGAPEASEAELRDLAHRLHGTAGSYGFDRISEAAARIEEAFDGGRAGALGPLVSDLVEAVGAAFAARSDAA